MMNLSKEVEIEKYGIHSKFDINKHAENFIDYLEIVIDPQGVAYYAVPSHRMFLENRAKELYGVKQFYKILELPESCDYLNWLCTITGCISVWGNFYYGKANSAQMRTLLRLKKKTYSKAPGVFLYQGSLERTR